jgi:anti-sigma factor RsiW
MQCKDVEAVIEQEGLVPLPAELNAHLAQCRECRNYVADLTSIVDVARKMPSEIAPPDRLWISLRAQLELEGIIKEPVLAPAMERASWWNGFSEFFRSRALATASVGLLLVIAAVFQLRNDNGAGVNTPPSIQPSVVASESFAATRTVLNDQEPVARGMILASTSPVDASLRENLQKVDDFIADCERRVKEEPQDDLAREYLSGAYQQKAELLSAMMDRGGSVN